MTSTRGPRMTQAEHHLACADDRLRAVIESTPRPKRSRNRDPYLALLQSVASQQLSGKAADTIFGRFCSLFPNDYPDPHQVVQLHPDRLREAGFSRQKSGYIQNIASYALEQDLSYEALDVLPDDAIIQQLTTIKGVGRWTVEMLLMFPMTRPDILPIDDLGIQQAMVTLYRLRSKGSKLKRRMQHIAEPWRPYRTLASRYLWRWKSGG